MWHPALQKSQPKGAWYLSDIFSYADPVKRATARWSARYLAVSARREGAEKDAPPFGGGQWLSVRPKSCPKKHQVYQVISSSFEYWETTRNWFGHNFKAIPCYQYIQSSSLQRTNLLCFAMAHGPKNTSWPSARQHLWNTGSKTIGNQRWEKGCWERSWKRLLGNPGCSRHLGQQRFTCTSSVLEIKRLEASSCQQHLVGVTQVKCLIFFTWNGPKISPTQINTRQPVTSPYPTLRKGNVIFKMRYHKLVWELQGVSSYAQTWMVRCDRLPNPVAISGKAIVTVPLATTETRDPLNFK